MYRGIAMQRLIKAIILIVGLGFSLTIFGCPPPIITKEEEPVYAPAPREPGPPPWAPTHGHRAKHRYQYYPESRVYFDVGRSLYFYHYGGGWQASVSLPPGIHISAAERISLDMDVDRPYLYHSDVEKRYPPGQLKKKGKGKGKKWD